MARYSFVVNDEPVEGLSFLELAKEHDELQHTDAQIRDLAVIGRSRLAEVRKRLGDMLGLNGSAPVARELIKPREIHSGGKARDRVYALLAKHPEGLGGAEVGRMLTMNPMYASMILKKAWEDGDLQRESGIRGRYTLPQQQEAATQ